MMVHRVPQTFRKHLGSIVCCVGVLLASSAALAQDPPLNATLLGTWDGHTGSYADVWGEGDFAYVATYVPNQAVVYILDVSDPANPTLASSVFIPPPNNFASPQDVKVHDGLMFVGLEFSGPDAAAIYDVRDPFNPVFLQTVRPQVPGTDYDTSHNLFYDNGYLYLADSSTARVAIVDLTTFDPDNPPGSVITSFKWLVEGIGTNFVHDITVQDGRMYAAGWSSGIFVYDVSDIANTAPVLMGSAPGSSTHSSWATDDGLWLVTAEEREGGGIKLYSVEQTGNSVTLTQTDSETLPTSQAYSIHNPLIVGNRVYCAWYQGGVRVYDINTSNGEFVLSAVYDTFPGGVSGFNGCWGVYPYLGEDRILATDLSNGFFTIDMSPQAQIFIVDGPPTQVHPLLETPMSVQVIDDQDPIGEESVTLHVIIGNDPEIQIPMELTESGIFEGAIPPVPCDVDVDFYVSLMTLAGETQYSPPGAPGNVYTASPITFVDEIARDNFETDTGWVVGSPQDDATTGIWTRGDPNGTGAQPEDDNPNGTGTLCFFTGQNNPGDLGGNDIDNGQTTLSSEIPDLTTLDDPYIGYARWYSNDQGADPNNDQMNIDISNNGGSTWTSLEVVTENVGAWKEVTFRVADFVTPTNNMMIRFIASDENSGSVVEAAIDDFVVLNVVCSELPGDADGNGELALADYAGFPACMTGPGGGVLGGCAIYDTDVDDDVDLGDFATIANAWTGSN